MVSEQKINFESLTSMVAPRRYWTRRKFKIPFLVLAPAYIAIAAMLFYFFSFNGLIGAAVLFGIYEIYIDELKTSAWLKFAKDNGWNVLSSTAYLRDPYFVPTSVSNIGYNHTAMEIIDVHFADKNFFVYNLEYLLGKGHNRVEYKYTVGRFQLEKDFPNILLQSKRSEGLSSNFGQKISLEGDFDEYFTLSIDEGEQIDALSVITPDIMQKLIRYGKKFDIELSGKNLYFYIGSDKRTPELVESLFNAINEIALEIIFRAQTINYLPKANKVEPLARVSYSHHSKPSFVMFCLKYWYTIIFVSFFIIFYGTSLLQLR